MYLSVVNTKDQQVMHDASRPYAVVTVNKETGKIVSVLGRFETYHGACVSCGRLAKDYQG